MHLRFEQTAYPGPMYYTEAKVALAGEMVMDGGFFNAQRGGNIGITKTVKPLFKE